MKARLLFCFCFLIERCCCISIPLSSHSFHNLIMEIRNHKPPQQCNTGRGSSNIGASHNETKMYINNINKCHLARKKDGGALGVCDTSHVASLFPLKLKKNLKSSLFSPKSLSSTAVSSGVDLAYISLILCFLSFLPLPCHHFFDSFHFVFAPCWRIPFFCLLFKPSEDLALHWRSFWPWSCTVQFDFRQIPFFLCPV